MSEPINLAQAGIEVTATAHLTLLAPHQNESLF